MDQSFSMFLAHKAHRFTTFSFEPKEDYHLLIPRFYQIAIEIKMQNLDPEGISFDFSICKISIKNLIQEFNKKVIVDMNKDNCEIEEIKENQVAIRFSQCSEFILENSQVRVIGEERTGQKFEEILAYKIKKMIENYQISYQELIISITETGDSTKEVLRFKHNE